MRVAALIVVASGLGAIPVSGIADTRSLTSDSAVRALDASVANSGDVSRRVSTTPVTTNGPAIPTGAAAASPEPAPPGDVAIAPPPATFDGPAAPPAPPPAELRSTQFDGVVPAGGVWAVVVGINDYPGGSSDLRSAVADAEDVTRALTRYGVPGDRQLLIRDRQASASTIEASVDWLVAHAGPDATAVFFFAGHVRKQSSGTEALVAADGRTISDAALANRLRGLQAHRTWIGIAACFAGGFTEVLAPGRILTGAADANNLAYENSQFGRSYMVEYMVRRAMVEGHAPASVEGSFAYASDALRREYPNRVPVQYDNADGDLSLGTMVVPASSPSSGGNPDSGAGGGGGNSGGGNGGSSPEEPKPPSGSGGPPSSDDSDDDDDDGGGCGVTFGSVVTCGRD